MGNSHITIKCLLKAVMVFENSLWNIIFTGYLPKVQERLKKVVIENLDFERLIKTYDRPNALFYLDPPYVGTERHYTVQFGEADHLRLAEALKGIKGRFILSYGDVPLIRELYSWCNIYSTIRPNNLAGTPSSKTFPEVIIKNF